MKLLYTFALLLLTLGATGCDPRPSSPPTPTTTPTPSEPMPSASPASR